MTALAGELRPPRRTAIGEFLASVTTMMVKELRSRFRGRRAFVVLTLYLAVLALIAYGAYSVVAPTAREQAQFGGGFIGGGNPNASATVGQAIFALLSIIQLLLVCFIAPALTAGAISLEREKQTLDLLVATPMRPGAIVIGKLLSALAFVVLMILAGIPVSALVLMYGGASVDDILRQQAVLFASAIGFGVIGLFFSALLKRTQTAIVLTYCTVLALTIGTLLIWRFWTAVATANPDNQFGAMRTAPDELLYVNPAVAMIEIVANTEVTFGDFSQILSFLLGSAGSDMVCQGDACFPVPVPQVKEGAVQLDIQPAIGRADGLGLNRAPMVIRPPAQGGADAAVAVTGVQALSNHFWPRFTLTFGAMSVLLTLASMRLVVPAGLRLGFRRHRSAVEAMQPPMAGDGEPAIEETRP
ncbi:MAG TPA: ABC transporter permease subunit [Candidatus Dormibacteraeota bacterium]|nr:ABC transporter permease subunit [Candidatus Dormibacteraeota bacterium]